MSTFTLHYTKYSVDFLKIHLYLHVMIFSLFDHGSFYELKKKRQMFEKFIEMFANNNSI